VTTTEPKSQLCVHVPADLHRRAKVRAIESNLKLHQIVAEGLKLVLDESSKAKAEAASA
jgi:hypothetical protein